MSPSVKKQILLASNNQGKLLELLKLLQPLDYEVLRLSQVPALLELPEPKETGQTFQANALLKAEYYSQFWSGPVVSDDSGLEVEVWNNQPGVNSNRWLEGTDEARNLALLAKLAELGATDAVQRKAKFVSVVCWLEHPQAVPRFFRGEVSGIISSQPRETRGFGYDPIFIPTGFNQTFAEMDLETKNQISHRGQAIKQLVEHLQHSD